MRFLPWRKPTEIEDLNQLDIGIMPLTDDIWSQGECGFKLLQYMAIKKPIIASPIGVNEKILTESQAGFSAETAKDWQLAIKNLLSDTELRNDLGENGRAFIKEKYSVYSNKSHFLSLFE